MRDEREKPQGEDGPIKIGGDEAIWDINKLPGPKGEREAFLANLFVDAFQNWVATESEPSFAPFTNLRQNEENDLDFTVETPHGEKLMELAEFAPLNEYGPRYTDAPKSIDWREKARLCEELIRKKSDRQGGDGRFLLLHVTEHSFSIDPLSIEKVRRALERNPPRFERVYYLSVLDREHGAVSELYPGKAHHRWGVATDDELDRINLHMPHPSAMIDGSAVVVRLPRSDPTKA